LQKRIFEISLPAGVSDFLPDTAGQIGFIEGKIKQVFGLWGYTRVIAPKIEFEEMLTIGMDSEQKSRAFRFDDRQTGRLLAIPTDITPQIARIVATRLKNHPLPFRLSYSGRVFRQAETGAGRSREIFQSGVELIGLDSPEADAELVAMAIEVMQLLGFEDFKVDIGQVEFCRGVFEASGLRGDALAAMQEAAGCKDSSAVERLMDQFGVSADSRAELSALPRLFGGREVLDNAALVVKNLRSAKALENLRQVVEILDIHGVGSYLAFDLGETRGMDYHSGVTFEGFVPGAGEALFSGGRYDLLLERYGFPAPATGMAFNVLSLLQCLKVKPELKRDLLVFNCKDDRREALEIAKILRSTGYSAVRDIIRRDMNGSLAYAERMGIRFLLVVGGEGCAEGQYQLVRIKDRNSFVVKKSQLGEHDLLDRLEMS
jgi:ATP phosphoribosyltransferase regulatory subunit